MDDAFTRVSGSSSIGYASAPTETKKVKNESQEKVSQCCCGIFSKMWEFRNEITLAVGSVVLIAGLALPDLIVCIVAGMILSSGFYGISALSKAKKNLEEMDNILSKLKAIDFPAECPKFESYDAAKKFYTDTRTKFEPLLKDLNGLKGIPFEEDSYKQIFESIDKAINNIERETSVEQKSKEILKKHFPSRIESFYAHIRSIIQDAECLAIAIKKMNQKTIDTV